MSARSSTPASHQLETIRAGLPWHNAVYQDPGRTEDDFTRLAPSRNLGRALGLAVSTTDDEQELRILSGGTVPLGLPNRGTTYGKEYA